MARYNKMRGDAPERLVSGSDDFTMFLWEPSVSKHPKTRMTGHQQVRLFFFFFLIISKVYVICPQAGITLVLLFNVASPIPYSFVGWKILYCLPSKTPICCFTQLVNHVYFSPDGQWVASASFDKSVKLWNGVTGKFVAAFRGHVGPVYQIRSDYSFFVYFSKFQRIIHCQNV